MKKRKTLNAKNAEQEQRLVELEKKAEEKTAAKNLLREQVEEALDEIDAGIERIANRKLKCRRLPIDQPDD